MSAVVLGESHWGCLDGESCILWFGIHLVMGLRVFFVRSCCSCPPGWKRWRLIPHIHRVPLWRFPGKEILRKVDWHRWSKYSSCAQSFIALELIC